MRLGNVRLDVIFTAEFPEKGFSERSEGIDIGNETLRRFFQPLFQSLAAWIKDFVGPAARSGSNRFLEPMRVEAGPMPPV